MEIPDSDYNWKLETELSGEEATYLMETEPPTQQEWKAVTGEETPPSREEWNDDYESAEITAKVTLEEGRSGVLEPEISLYVDGRLKDEGFHVSGPHTLTPENSRYQKFNEVVK